MSETEESLVQIRNELIEANLTCADLADALIKLEGTPSYLPEIQLRTHMDGGYRHPTRKIISIGRAFTCEMTMADSPDPRRPALHQVDDAPEGSIICIVQPRQCVNAVWGGLMSARALKRNVQGVVIDGNCRDLLEHTEFQFPVWSRGISCLGAPTFTRPLTVQEPIVILPPTASTTTSSQYPSITIHPGDLICADVDGVVVVPWKKVRVVLEAAKRGLAVDQLCMHDIQAGKSVREAFQLHRSAT